MPPHPKKTLNNTTIQITNKDNNLRSSVYYEDYTE